MEQQTLFGGEVARPLASRMRPRTLEEFFGQEKLLGEGKILRQLIDSDNVPSMIFWGPPGVGKTTLARIIARRTKAEFVDFSAVTSGVKEIKAVMERAEDVRRFGQKTILFVDEIHRFNKAQQDAFLPYVERGSIVLIGATTENPSFEINSALLSRCKVFVLEALTPAQVTAVLRRALADERGFGGQRGAREAEAGGRAALARRTRTGRKAAAAKRRTKRARGRRGTRHPGTAARRRTKQAWGRRARSETGGQVMPGPPGVPRNRSVTRRACPRGGRPSARLRAVLWACWHAKQARLRKGDGAEKTGNVRPAV